MHALIKSLVESGPVVTDGSWGTQIQKRGLKRGESPDSWNLTHPDKVEEIAGVYVEAGSRIILTNTFQANRFALERYDLADKASEINRAGVAISQKAAGDSVFVFASMGPSGKMLFTGDVKEAQLQEAFEEQATALAEAGADGIIVETMMNIDEARIAAQAAQRTGLPVIASMVFDAGEHKDMTMMGNSPEEVAEALSKIGVDGVGANCGRGPEDFVPICRRMRQTTDLPLWMKPNAGVPEVVDDKEEAVVLTTPEMFVKPIPDLIKAGANFIGGCCETDERFIAEICKVIARN